MKSIIKCMKLCLMISAAEDTQKIDFDKNHFHRQPHSLISFDFSKHNISLGS
jgi:hypothetical protein